MGGGGGGEGGGEGERATAGIENVIMLTRSR